MPTAERAEEGQGALSLLTTRKKRQEASKAAPTEKVEVLPPQSGRGVLLPRVYLRLECTPGTPPGLRGSVADRCPTTENMSHVSILLNSSLQNEGRSRGEKFSGIRAFRGNGPEMTVEILLTFFKLVQSHCATVHWGRELPMLLSLVTQRVISLGLSERLTGAFLPRVRGASPRAVL